MLANLVAVAPNSELEPFLGDGAIALLIGDRDEICSFEGDYSYTEVFTDVWRGEDDSFSRTWEPGFARVVGFPRIMGEGLSQAIKEYGFHLRDFAKVVAYGPSEREVVAVLDNLGESLSVFPSLWRRHGRSSVLYHQPFGAGGR